KTSSVPVLIQRIRLYCLGKDNGENIMKSIKEGPFQIWERSQMLLLEELRVQFNKVQYVLESLMTF
ncbi:hypothetical protein Tco_0589653, partial [Tanacetum coccineum]